MTTITSIRGLEILDSRGNPTVEVEVALEAVRQAGPPCLLALPPEPARPWNCATATKAASAARVSERPSMPSTATSRRHCAGMGFDQIGVDRTLRELDGSDNKSRLGANAILGVSLAVAKAAAASVGLPLWRYVGGASACVLPVPMMNVINGGAHADNPIDFQEFMIMPVGRRHLAKACASARRSSTA